MDGTLFVKAEEVRQVNCQVEVRTQAVGLSRRTWRAGVCVPICFHCERVVRPPARLPPSDAQCRPKGTVQVRITS